MSEADPITGSQLVTICVRRESQAGLTAAWPFQFQHFTEHEEKENKTTKTIRDDSTMSSDDFGEENDAAHWNRTMNTILLSFMI